MDTLTIEIRDPKVRDLLANLANLNLITILPGKTSWRDRWQVLSDSLPHTTDISEQDILDEIDAVRERRTSHP